MSKKNVIYHIGLPKTGTNFLQKIYFQNLRGDFTYIKRYPYPEKDNLEWNQYVNKKINNITPAQDRLLNASTVIYSDETISNLWLPVDEYNQPSIMGDVADRVVAFHKLKFREICMPHILIGFRSFNTWIVSYYAELSTLTSFDRLLDDVEKTPARYSRYAIERCFRERFDSVFVYEQEEISRDLQSLNNWFRNFELDGQHIIPVECNRLRKNHNQYSKRLLNLEGRFVKLHSLYRRWVPLSVRFPIAAWVNNVYTKNIVISDSQLERARMIGKKLQAMDSSS